jgi:hypothetical protein
VIARVWFGRTKAEDYDAYLAYLEDSVISLWDSIDDVKAFAGEDVDVARYFPEDERYLLELTPRLKHFEVARER